MAELEAMEEEEVEKVKEEVRVIYIHSDRLYPPSGDR